MRKLWWGLIAARGAIALGTICATEIARADDLEPIRFVYEAPAQCPDLTDLLSRIRARTARFVHVDRGDDTREFRIRITGRAPSRGSLTVAGAGQRPATRAFAGATCDEIVATLAFAAALAIDPLAIEPPPPPSLPSVPPPPPPFPASPPISPPAPPALLPFPERPREQPVALAPFVGSSIGAFTGVSWPVAPSRLYGLGAFAELHLPTTVEPTLRLAVETASSPERDVGAARVFFTRTFGALEACAVPWRPARDLVLSSCGRFSAGAFRARAQDVVNATSASRLWLATGALARLRWHLAPAVFVDGAVGLEAALWRDDYRLIPGVDVHDMPILSGLVAVALGHDLP